MPDPVRIALVTGGSRGIGLATAVSLRALGYDVRTPGRDELDLLDPASIDRYIAAHANDGVSVLVNNAGINPIEPFDAITPENWSATLQTNLTAPLRLTQGFAPGMKAAGWGRVVNIASIWAVVTKTGRASYASSKTALLGLTRSSAVELAPHGVLVNAVCPGFVETELTRANNTPAQLAAVATAVPLGRLARPEEIAKVVAFLASADNTYITGQAIVADGGYVCL